MIKRYDPFQDFILLKDTFKAIEDGLAQNGEASNVWAPKIDVGESEKAILVKTELAGVNKEDIKIDVTGDTLSISGEKKWEDTGEDVKYHKIERTYGAFTRTFKIGVPIDADNIKATYKNGVLEITVPKAEALTQKKIEISN